jgi:hypothetical protein
MAKKKVVCLSAIRIRVWSSSDERRRRKALEASRGYDFLTNPLYIFIFMFAYLQKENSPCSLQLLM